MTACDFRSVSVDELRRRYFAVYSNPTWTSGLSKVSTSTTDRSVTSSRSTMIVRWCSARVYVTRSCHTLMMTWRTAFACRATLPPAHSASSATPSSNTPDVRTFSQRRLTPPLPCGRSTRVVHGSILCDPTQPKPWVNPTHGQL